MTQWCISAYNPTTNGVYQHTTKQQQQLKLTTTTTTMPNSYDTLPNWATRLSNINDHSMTQRE